MFKDTLKCLFRYVTDRECKGTGKERNAKGKAPVECRARPSEGGDPTDWLRDRCFDGCYGNQRQTFELVGRKAPSSAWVVKDLGPVSWKPWKPFDPGKTLQNLEPYDNRAIFTVFYSRILNINRGSLHRRGFRRIHISVLRYRWTKCLNGPENFPGLSRNGPVVPDTALPGE